MESQFKIKEVILTVVLIIIVLVTGYVLYNSYWKKNASVVTVVRPELPTYVDEPLPDLKSFKKLLEGDARFGSISSPGIYYIPFDADQIKEVGRPNPFIPFGGKGPSK
ncbi:MAG: hypothetical protein HYW78_01730 [Parcubacteria group bacterium]|nr:hypothetical protein [Parcubacteria group bacterium]